MNKYSPTIHHRRNIRLKGFDYSQAGLYFVTICCHNMTCRFGTVDNDEMVLNDFGQFAYDEWEKLPERYQNMFLDVFQIMPNHVHGIIALENDGCGGGVGATLADAQNNDAQNDDANDNTAGADTMVVYDNGATDNNRATARVAPTMKPTVGAIVGAYKSLVANKCLEIYTSCNEYMGKLWQRNYHEHIIRDQKSYETISEYIINNPQKWENDKFYME